MRKGQLFNSDVCHVLSKLGHTDCIAIGDAGLPIPDSTQRIDLALTKDIPSFLQVFNVVSTDMQIEKVVLAEEIKQKNPTIHQKILQRIQEVGQLQKNTVMIEYVPHEEFKQQTAACKAVIRTGECSPYANIILQSGVFF
ncbi:D-ribose pyranase [Zophobihabitans entericus]|uniref:D-ribose pyranase n=1 Tax=Zophobihabitans entericus TaxID=1635327 RepID=A0A6G9ID89_9GAMM|nr:D-ribose pyranase [Zophobihabitans entericus]QIQ21550.1 D-ribose pyranase [Zophobihabitans entericus]